jgi:predicted ester cyclase
VTSFKTYHGTHRGDFMGTAPTGRSFDAMDIMRVRDGKITDHWGVSDAASLMRQLGARS